MENDRIGVNGETWENDCLGTVVLGRGVGVGRWREDRGEEVE